MSGPMIERRRIEAEILREVYKSATDVVGKEHARTIIERAVRTSAIEQARQFAARAPGGTSLANFVDIQKYWTAENALEIELECSDATHFEFKVTRCRYAEMYKDMGLGDIGDLLSCNRDGSFCEGYDPKLKLTRTQTIMGGASHCDFKFHYEGKPESSDGD